MGKVFLGRSPDGRPVAVKIVRDDLAGERGYLARFRREAEAARRVARFCTAEVLDVGIDHERPYLVTEYLDGPTLRSAVGSRGPLPVVDVERLAIAMATALTAIHSAGLAHRDLKPGNVMLTSSGPRVIDFGIARLLDFATTTSSSHDSFGTPAYMSPEQAMSESTGTSADIFAWGGVVIFAGTGRTPFGDGPTPQVLYRIVHEEPDLSGLDGALLAVVAEAMRKDSNERPTASELVTRLTRRPSAAGQQPAHHMPTAPAPAKPDFVPAIPESDARRGRRRLPRSVPAAVAGLVCASVGGAVMLLATQGETASEATGGGTSQTPTSDASTAATSLSATPLLATPLPVSATPWPATSLPAASSLATSPPATSSPATSHSPPPEPGWEATFAGLNNAVSAAFDNSDPSILNSVYAAGSPALAEDIQDLQLLIDRGAHTVGLRRVVESLRVIAESDGTASLRIVSRLDPYTVVANADGSVLADMPGQPARTLDVTLVDTSDGWRIVQFTVVAQ